LLDGKNILITGGTGSLGSALVEKFLSLNPGIIRIFSRDENKQIQMEEKFNDKRLRFLIGDVRDKDRLRRAVENIDIVIHTAALKQVPLAEYNPFEVIKTNIYGSQNVIDVSMDEEVELCLAISTDKAVSPLNLYGASKLSMEKLFIAANNLKGRRKTKFSCVRYGNVLGSRGSVVPKFIEQIKSKQQITVTDPTMTRFSITLDEALKLILHAIKNSKGYEVFVPKLQSYLLSDLISVFNEISTIPFAQKKINVRSGEKLHELLLNEYEVNNSIEVNDVYILLPSDFVTKTNLQELYPNAKKLNMSVYSSGNVTKIPRPILKKILIDNNFTV